MPSHLQLQRSKEKPTGAKNKKEEKRINSGTKEEDATAQLPSNIQEVSRAKTGEEGTRRTVKVRETQLALKVNCLQLAKEPKLNEEGTTIKEEKKNSMKSVRQPSNCSFVHQHRKTKATSHILKAVEEGIGQLLQVKLPPTLGRSSVMVFLHLGVATPFTKTIGKKLEASIQLRWWWVKAVCHCPVAKFLCRASKLWTFSPPAVNLA
ncbi:hypothetical protein O6P43_025467 [Quillaja saponaria]|uniref:Uncharacterized protein n=1 Tax=Quillaja saponaria TaxID=32244 RepID=A0AAD7PFM2_QUISA|nr:hypothetical protein O6P43_025467 [Quillaja saponaria]